MKTSSIVRRHLFSIDRFTNQSIGRGNYHLTWLTTWTSFVTTSQVFRLSLVCPGRLAIVNTLWNPGFLRVCPESLAI